MCETHDMLSLHRTYIRDKYNIASTWNDGSIIPICSLLTIYMIIKQVHSS